MLSLLLAKIVMSCWILRLAAIAADLDDLPDGDSVDGDVEDFVDGLLDVLADLLGLDEEDEDDVDDDFDFGGIGLGFDDEAEEDLG